MKNQDLAEKIKELRGAKGFSQEQLSEISGISIRTIQRLEGGKTIPTGDTLKRISTALDASIDGLIINEMKEDKGYLLLITLSAISYILLPFLGILLPTLLWYFKRHKILNADETGRKLISFQITWQLIFFLYLGFESIAFLRYYNNSLAGWSELNFSKNTFMIIFYSIYFFNLFMILVNLLLIQFGANVRYIISIPFMWKKEN